MPQPQRSCFDGMMGLFDEAALIEGHCLFPTIEWSDDERAQVSDEDELQTPKLRAARVSLPTCSLERQLCLLRSSVVLDQLPHIQPTNW